MIECPVCSHKEFTGALFCQECGAKLIGISGLTTQTIRVKVTPPVPELQAEQAINNTPAPPVDVAIYLHILDTGDVVPLEGTGEFTMGRSTEGYPFLPDIDLAPYSALENGVSRLHTSINLGIPQALVTDIGSANGTWLNGLKLSPNSPSPIKHGDILTLGKLKIQLLIRR